MPPPQTPYPYRSTPPSQAGYATKRAAIEDAYKKIYDNEAAFNALVKKTQYVLPPVVTVMDQLMPLYRVVHRLWADFENGDWYFDDLAAHDVETWERINQAFLKLGDYLGAMENFGNTEEDNETLRTGTGGNDVRQSIDRAAHNAVLELTGQKAPDDTANGYDPATGGRFPGGDISFPPDGRTPTTSGGSNPWLGSPGRNYQAALGPQAEAANILGQLALSMNNDLTTVRSSYNDYLSAVQMFLVTVLGFVVTVVVTVMALVKEYIAAISSPAFLTVGPAIMAAFVAQLGAIISAVASTVVACVAFYIQNLKNKDTLVPSIQKLEGHIETAKATTKLASGHWPNPLNRVQFPEAAQNRSGYWVIAASAGDRGLDSTRDYWANRNVEEPWWNPPRDP